MGQAAGSAGELGWRNSVFGISAWNCWPGVFWEPKVLGSRCCGVSLKCLVALCVCFCVFAGWFCVSCGCCWCLVGACGWLLVASWCLFGGSLCGFVCVCGGVFAVVSCVGLSFPVCLLCALVLLCCGFWCCLPCALVLLCCGL